MLEVRNLRTSIQTNTGDIKVLDDVSLEINQGEIVGLVGESGCGKSMTALSILRLLPEPFAKIISGEIMFEGSNIATLSESQLEEIRGNRISMIFQDPSSALDPILSSGNQIVEAIRAHKIISKEEALKSAVALLDSVGIPEAKIRAAQYPFQLSGGMKQRVMIAMALSCDPSLIIADEPTTNLDVSIQAQILQLLKSITKQRKTSILLITHNLAIVAWLCDRVYVMYAGKIVEQGTTERVFNNPSHPYTELLMKAVPKLSGGEERLQSIAGHVPSLLELPAGCRFNPRCPYVKKICRRVEPALVEIEPGHFSRCLMRDPALWNERDLN